MRLHIDSLLTHEEILDTWLSTTYFGHEAYGLEAASRMYLKKAASDLNLAEAALLACIPSAPSRMNPINNADRAAKCQARVLKTMYAESLISLEEYEADLHAP